MIISLLFLSVCVRTGTILDSGRDWNAMFGGVTHWSEKLEEDVVGETLESALQTDSRPCGTRLLMYYPSRGTTALLRMSHCWDFSFLSMSNFSFFLQRRDSS